MAIETREELRAQLIAASGFPHPNRPTPTVTAGLADLAVQEGLGPLLGARLKAGEIEVESEAVKARLLREYYACCAHHLLREQQTAGLWAALRNRGIPVLLLKGAALAKTVYRDPGERPMADLDCLVPRAQWREAVHLAVKAGGSWKICAKRRVTGAHGYAADVALQNGMVVEIHRRLDYWPQFAVDYPGIFRRARVLENGESVPSPEDCLLTLAIHAAKSGYVLPLRAVVDGLTLVTRRPIDQDELARRAAEWRAKRAVAAWLRTLARFGLTGPWAALAASIAPLQRRDRQWLGSAPWNQATLKPDHFDWNWRLRVARLLDGPGRAAAWVVYRALSRFADIISHRAAARA
jgi:hypothetical protein